ncbi:MAG: hypothetical protein PHR82_01920 [Endomicrobiaceae bacterium]|nr:hypothetical protein [Endomicrobiaceae bacterium]
MNKFKIFVFLILTFVMVISYNYFISIKKINNRAVEELKNGNFKDFETEFKKMLKRKTDDYILKFNYANLKYKISNYEEALAVYEKILQEGKINNLEKSEIYYNIGNIYFLYDDYDKALEYYKLTLFLNPIDMDAMYNIEYIMNLIWENEEIAKIAEAFKEDLNEQKNKIEEEETKITGNLKEVGSEKQVKNEEVAKIATAIAEKKQLNTKYIKDDLQYLLQEKQNLLAQKQELEKTISKQSEDNIQKSANNSLSEEDKTANLKLEEQKNILESKLKENFKKTNNKVEMLEKIEDNIFQEVVRPEKVINPKKIIDGYFAPSYADDKKVLIEEEKEVIYRNLNQIDYSDIEKKEEKKQIVYNVPPLENEKDNKKSKYKYEHEDIIQSQNSLQNQQKDNLYVQNAFEQINIQKQKILEQSNNEQSEILREMSKLNKEIAQKNISEEQNLYQQQQLMNNSIEKLSQEKTNVENEINSTQNIEEREKLKDKLNDISNKERLSRQKLDEISNNIQSLIQERQMMGTELEKNILEIKENVLNHQLQTTEKIDSMSGDLNDVYKQHDNLLKQKESENMEQKLSQIQQYEQKISNNTLMQKLSVDKKELVNHQYNQQLELLENSINNLKNITEKNELDKYNKIFEEEKNKLVQQNQKNEMQKLNIEDLKNLADEKSKVKIEEKVLSVIEQQNAEQKNEIEKLKQQMDKQIEKIAEKQQKSLLLNEQKKQLDAKYDEILNKQMQLNAQKMALKKTDKNQNQQDKIDELTGQEKIIEKDRQDIENQRKEVFQKIKEDMKNFKSEIAKEYQRNMQSLQRQIESKEKLHQKTKIFEDAMQQKINKEILEQQQNNKYELKKMTLRKNTKEKDLKDLLEKQNLTEKKLNENIDMELAKTKNENKRLLEKQIEKNKEQMQLLEDTIKQEKNSKIKEDLINNKQYLQTNINDLEKQVKDIKDNELKDGFQNILEKQKKQSFENIRMNEKQTQSTEVKLAKSDNLDINKSMAGLEKQKLELEEEETRIKQEQKSLLSELESVNRSLKEKVTAQKRLEHLRQQSKQLEEIKKSIEKEESKINEFKESKKERNVEKFERFEKAQEILQNEINENSNKIKNLNEQKVNIGNDKTKESILKEMWRNQDKSGANNQEINKDEQKQQEEAINELKKQQEETRKLNNKLIQQQKMLEENIKNLKQNINKKTDEKEENQLVKKPQETEKDKKTAELKKQMQKMQKKIKDINRELTKNKEAQMGVEKDKQKAEHGKKWANSEKDIASLELKKQQEALQKEKEKLDQILKKQRELEAELEKLRRQYNEDKNANIERKIKTAESDLIKTMDQRLQVGQALSSNKMDEMKMKYKNMDKESKMYASQVSDSDNKLEKLKKTEEQLKTEKNKMADEFEKSMAEMADLDSDFDPKENEDMDEQSSDTKSKKIGNQDLNRVLNFYGDMDKPENDKKIKGQEIDETQRDW